MTVGGNFPERYTLTENGIDKVILENDDLFILQNEPLASIDYMNAKDSEWFNSDVRCDIGTKLLMTAVNAKWHSLYHGDSPLTELTPDGNIMGPSDVQISNLSWLPSKILDFHNNLSGSGDMTTYLDSYYYPITSRDDHYIGVHIDKNLKEKIIESIDKLGFSIRSIGVGIFSAEKLADAVFNAKLLDNSNITKIPQIRSRKIVFKKQSKFSKRKCFFYNL